MYFPVVLLEEVEDELVEELVHKYIVKDFDIEYFSEGGTFIKWNTFISFFVVHKINIILLLDGMNCFVAPNLR